MMGRRKRKIEGLRNDQLPWKTKWNKPQVLLEGFLNSTTKISAGSIREESQIVNPENTRHNAEEETEDAVAGDPKIQTGHEGRKTLKYRKIFEPDWRIMTNC